MNARGRAPLWALIPVKPFARAKSRLASVLGAEERAAFARSMLEHVLGVVGACPELGGALVVTSCPEATALARARGAIALPDVATAKLAVIVDAGLRDLSARGAGGALVLMSDLPRLVPEDVLEMARRMREREVVAAPDFRGEGTNALGISPPERLATSFGTRDSFTRHTEAARRGGIEVGVVRRDGLALDVDEPEDLARLRSVIRQHDRSK